MWSRLTNKYSKAITRLKWQLGYLFTLRADDKCFTVAAVKTLKIPTSSQVPWSLFLSSHTVVEGRNKREIARVWYLRSGPRRRERPVFCVHSIARTKQTSLRDTKQDPRCRSESRLSNGRSSLSLRNTEHRHYPVYIYIYTDSSALFSFTCE